MQVLILSVDDRRLQTREYINLVNLFCTRATTWVWIGSNKLLMSVDDSLQHFSSHEKLILSSNPLTFCHLFVL